MIDVCGVSKSYGKVAGVERVSFQVPAQGLRVLYGPSGSGKTTLLRLIAGLEIPDEGEIALNGEQASRPGWALAPHRRGIGFMFQTPALWPHLTVAQNVAFGLHGLPKNESRERLHHLLDQAGLAHLARRYPHQLSGGEARRVALARTLAPRPACLLLDEPLANLDPESKDRLRGLVLEIVRNTQACLVWVTHDAEEASFIS
ncbi:MAG: ATP-binding cassette domain-containing protein, partial [Chloroflexota bacterium]